MVTVLSGDEWARRIGCSSRELLEFLKPGDEWCVRRLVAPGELGPMVRGYGPYPDPVRWDADPEDWEMTSDMSVDDTVRMLRQQMGMEAPRPSQPVHGSGRSRSSMSGDLVKDAKALGIRVRTLARLEKQGHSADDVRRDLGKALSRYRHMSRDEAAQRWYKEKD